MIWALLWKLIQRYWVIIFIGLLALSIGNMIWFKSKDRALEGVRKNNEKVIQRSEDATSDFDLCYRSNRVWDYRRGKCLGPQTRGRE
jgi:hypothetical protein